MSSRSRRAGLFSVLILLLAFAAPTYAQDAEEPEVQPVVDPAVMKAALPLVVEDFVLVGLKRNTTSHMGIEGTYFRVDKLMALISGTLEGGPSDHQAFRIQTGFGPMSDGRAQSVRDAEVPRVTLDGLPQGVEVYDDSSQAQGAMIDANAQKMMMVQGGASSARVALMTSVASALAGEATAAAPSTDNEAVRRVQAVYDALPARAGQHEMIEYEIAESKELAESNQLAFRAIYANPDQPRGTRIAAGLVLPGDTRSNRLIQQVNSLGDDLRRDTTLAGREAVVVGTGETTDGPVTTGNDRAIVLFPFDGYQIMVVAQDRDIAEEDVIALASALNLSGLADE